MSRSFTKPPGVCVCCCACVHYCIYVCVVCCLLKLRGVLITLCVCCVLIYVWFECSCVCVRFFVKLFLLPSLILLNLFFVVKLCCVVFGFVVPIPISYKGRLSVLISHLLIHPLHLKARKSWRRTNVEMNNTEFH